MNTSDIVSPEDQPVTFVELFFDLVFVFSVTQVVGLLHDGLDLESVGQALLVFWLVWWAWTQFTWALNAANTRNTWIALGTLLATGIAFFMAIAAPDAFHGRALWFALPYVAVRTVGLILYAWVAQGNLRQRAALRTFTIVSIGGLTAVVAGGVAGAGSQHWFWGIAIALDLFATALGGQSEGWDVHPEHFVERHGLFVIIALGETLIVAAGAVAGIKLTGDLITISVLSVALTCAIWWSYFASAQPLLGASLAKLDDASRTLLARDAFSILHFPMLCGVILYAVAIEELVAHPNQPLVFEGRLALSLGVSLFVIGMSGAVWRAAGVLTLPRMLLVGGACAVALIASSVSPIVTLAIVFAGVVATVVQESYSENLSQRAEDAQ